MQHFTEITCDIELQAGGTLVLPKEITDAIGPGHWQVSIRPASVNESHESIRNHAAFLNSYAPEDECLYDDYLAG
jgi:hypothetical protein